MKLNLTSKKDKRTKMEKAIDSLLEQMPDYEFKKRSGLDKAIERALLAMEQYEPNSDEYATILDNVEKLCKAKKDDRDAYDELVDKIDKLYKAKSCEKNKGVNWDTIAIILGNLLGIVLILGYEKIGVITSKALGFVIKGRV